MNHDATHCDDYKVNKCPKECYRAQLTQDLRERQHDLCYLPISWANESGELNEVSIGCAVSATVCSICGEEIQVCPHKKGHYYNGRLCCGELISPYEAYEWSFVAKPKAAMSEPKSITPEAAIIELNRIRTNKGERPPEIDMAITAINRCFVKRKPVANEEGGVECPICGMSIDESDSEKYCLNCGQALDWT